MLGLWLGFARRRLLVTFSQLSGSPLRSVSPCIEQNVLQVWCLYCVISQAIIALILLLSLGW